MSQITVALIAALALFLVRRYLFSAYAEGRVSVWVPTVAFALVWASLPFAGAAAGLWRLDLVSWFLSIFAFVLVGSIMRRILPGLVSGTRRGAGD